MESLWFQSLIGIYVDSGRTCWSRDSEFSSFQSLIGIYVDSGNKPNCEEMSCPCLFQSLIGIYVDSGNDSKTRWL